MRVALTGYWKEDGQKNESEMLGELEPKFRQLENPGFYSLNRNMKICNSLQNLATVVEIDKL